MKYYPIYLDLRERPCVVIGGGRVAERKALSLLEAGADVTVVSPSLSPKLRATLGQLHAGKRVNLEIDLIARYVERMLGGSLPRH